MDSKNIHSAQHSNIQGIIPAARSFMAGEMNDYIGAAFISGGKMQDQKTACDMWALNVDWAVQYIENPKEIRMENIWT